MSKSRRLLPWTFIVVAITFWIGWPFIQNAIWPPVQRKPTERDLLGFVAGNGIVIAEDVGARQRTAERNKLGLAAGPIVVAAEDVGSRRIIAAELREKRIAAEKAKQPPVEFLGLGWGEKPYHLQVLLTPHGGAIQQVILTHFQQANREGLPVETGDKKADPLHLIPGVKQPRASTLKGQDEVSKALPTLAPGVVKVSPDDLTEPSYALYHYERESDGQPVDTLGRKLWRVVRNEPAADGDSHLIAFETELDEPFFVKITKTFTLSRNDYHVGLTVAIEPQPNRPAGAAEKLRYQITGPNGLPIEGEWYTTTFRQAIVCWADGGSANRSLETPQEIAHSGGSERHASTDRRPIRFAGMMLQYFTSVLALDNDQPVGQKADYIEYVRFTPDGPAHPKGQEFLDDFTFRAISKPVPTDKPVEHKFVLYQGPVKVRLLKQLEGDQAVPEDTVNRYRDDLSLRMLTDAHFPNWFGRVSNFFWWTDLIIAFTNLIHSLLGLLTKVIPNVGVCIILITFAVRILLHPFSRRQMINAKIMQAKQEKLAPEYKKLQEKYGDDYNRLQTEKMKLMREHGINPSAMFGGCLLLLCQMPVFMGLYYALQESVFFRLEPFLWIPNLAAPDMLARWGESIPWLSEPTSLGGMIYVGPYLNILPLIAVALMLYTQMKMMPKSDDPQVQMQQKMMKFMMIIMLFLFYKSPAGLAIYFICSSLWGIVERRLIPKNIAELEEQRKAKKAAELAARGEQPEAPKGWLGQRMAGWREKWQQILDEAQKQQQLQRESPDRGTGPQTRSAGQNQPPAGGANGKKKKKKR